MELAKTFEPAEIEKRWYAQWENAGYFKAGDAPGAPPYCIMLPPPNVTGTLHMGHAFQQTLMDALTRYHRMRGFNVNWVAGTDHAGIATQIVVERQLQEQGKTRHDLGRDNVFFLHVSLVPYLAPSGELKTKPTQHSVAALRQVGPVE